MLAPVQITNINRVVTDTPMTPLIGVDGEVEYSSVCPFSHDNQWLLLAQQGGWFGLYTGDGQLLRILPSDVHTRSSPRWKRDRADEFTFLVNQNGDTLTQIRSFNVGLKESIRVHEFPEYVSIDDEGEADVSIAGASRVLCGMTSRGQREVFVFDMSTRRKGSVYVQAEQFDGLKLSGSNLPILSKPSGMHVLEGGRSRQVAPYNSHAAPAWMKGRDVLLWFDNSGKRVILMAIDIQTGEHFPLWEGGGSVDYAYHVSVCDKPFCVVSGYAPTRPDLPMQIIKVGLDLPIKDLLAESEVLYEKQIVYRGYSSQPKASLARDGSRLVFNQDDGQNVNVMLLRLDEDEPAERPSEPFQGFKELEFTNGLWIMEITAKDGLRTFRMFAKE